MFQGHLSECGVERGLADFDASGSFANGKTLGDKRLRAPERTSSSSAVSPHVPLGQRPKIAHARRPPFVADSATQRRRRHWQHPRDSRDIGGVYALT
jgi:hypothetical protein